MESLQLFSFKPTAADVSSTSSLPSKQLFHRHFSETRSLIRPRITASTANGTIAASAAGTAVHRIYIPNKISDPSYIRVLDTTLRDGEQAPGATMTGTQKLAIARQLVALGVDIIEAGVPASGRAEFEITKMISREVGNPNPDNKATLTESTNHVPVICAASRLVGKDIETTWEALKYAKHPRLNIFIPTSEIHMKYKLNKTKEQVLQTVKDMVHYTRSLGITDIEFISEDSARSEKEFLYQVFGEAIEAGATTITFCDTVGCMFPDEWGRFIADMKANIRGAENVVISTHCHNDLGLATANTLAAVSAGARQVEVTVNGIGERAGNAPLEEFVMALKCRGKYLLDGLHTGIHTKHIATTSKMVEECSGLSIQPHKPIVGINAFAHASGIHQDGVLKHKATYEILSPEDVGISRSTDNHGIVLGKLSGRAALKSRLLELGYEMNEEAFDDVFERFKAIAANKKNLKDNDLELLVMGNESLRPKDLAWQLLETQLNSSRGASKSTIGTSLPILERNSEELLEPPSDCKPTLRGTLKILTATVDPNDSRQLISLAYGDPTPHSCFGTTAVAHDAVAESLFSNKFNGYPPITGLPQTRMAIAEYLSKDLPYKLSSDDVYVTAGCTQSIDVALSSLARPGANVLIPRPGFPMYELCASFRNLQVRHYNLLLDKGWEVDLSAIHSLADHNTVGIVIINPGNPCGNVYTYKHLNEIAEAAKKHKMVVIADEVYEHLAFGRNPFVRMGAFGSIAPVLTLGSLSKRWLVPGWRLGWFVTTDPNAIYKTPKTVEHLHKYLDVCGSPATFIQAAVPRILEQTNEDFFEGTVSTLRDNSEICYDTIKNMSCFTCPTKPQGSMAFMVKLDLLELRNIKDDLEFCLKLAKEESVIILPGVTVGLKNWVRITFAVDPFSLKEALERVKAFCQRNSRI